MGLVGLYWKQLLALLLLAVVGLSCTLFLKNNKIDDLINDKATLEAKLAVSNSSVESLQRSVERQNQQMQDIIGAQTLKQKEIDVKIKNLQLEKKNLQTQIDEVMNTPETGNECADIQAVLQSVGE